MKDLKASYHLIIPIKFSLFWKNKKNKKNKREDLKKNSTMRVDYDFIYLFLFLIISEKILVLSIVNSHDNIQDTYKS